MARIYGAHLVTLARWNRQFGGMAHGAPGHNRVLRPRFSYMSYRWLPRLPIEENGVVTCCERGAKDNAGMEVF